MKKNKLNYVEPSDYFPKEIRKEFGLGEFNTEVNGSGKQISENIPDKESKARKSKPKKTKQED